MKAFLQKKQFTFYLWVGLAFLILWLFNDLVKYPDTFIPRISNNIWRTVYAVALNDSEFKIAV